MDRSPRFLYSPGSVTDRCAGEPLSGNHTSWSECRGTSIWYPVNANASLRRAVIAIALAMVVSGCSAVRVATTEYHQHDDGFKVVIGSTIDRRGSADVLPDRPHSFETKVGWYTNYYTTSGSWHWDAFQYRGAVQFLRLTDRPDRVGGAVERATLQFRVRETDAVNCSGEALRRILVAAAPWRSGYDDDPTTHDDGLEPSGRDIPFVRGIEIPFRVRGDFIEADVTDVVRRWLSGALPNHGFLLLSQERFARIARPNAFVEASCASFYNDFVLIVRTPGFVTHFSRHGRSQVPRGAFDTR